MLCTGRNDTDEDIVRKRVSGEIDQQLARERKDFSKTHRLLLLGKTVHTVCVCIDLIVEITCDCVVCTCNNSVGPRKSSLWLSGSPREIR